jgi:hypothetical protein
MQCECGEKAETQDPEDACGRNDRIEQLAQEFCVLVEVLGPDVHLQVADHVEEHESHQHDAGESHDPFLAH